MPFSEKSIEWIADLLAHAAASEIMPRFRQLGAGDIRQKTSSVDLVTEADLRAEHLITTTLKERYPEALVVGEEASETDPCLLEGLADAPLAFVVDPVDGTFNFASGVPLFGVMLSIIAGGEAIAGIIHDPVGRDWLIGVKGAGSHIRRRNGTMSRVQVAAPAPISDMTGSISWQFIEEPVRSRLARNHAKCRSHIGYRCAAHEYRLIAGGHAHFALYNKLMPWDHLAGTLIHSEAGGYAARFDGSPYMPFHLNGGLLIAPDGASWQELRRELWAES